MVARVKQERRGLGGCVDVVVVLEFRKGQEFPPIVLSFTDKESEVLFEFLVDALGLSVCLRVVGGGRGDLDVEEVVEFARELRDELRASVRDYNLLESVVAPDVVEVESRGTECGNSGMCLDEVGALAHRVYDNHDHVVTF